MIEPCLPRNVAWPEHFVSDMLVSLLQFILLALVQARALLPDEQLTAAMAKSMKAATIVIAFAMARLCPHTHTHEVAMMWDAWAVAVPGLCRCWGLEFSTLPVGRRPKLEAATKLREGQETWRTLQEGTQHSEESQGCTSNGNWRRCILEVQNLSWRWLTCLESSDT